MRYLFLLLFFFACKQSEQPTAVLNDPKPIIPFANRDVNLPRLKGAIINDIRPVNDSIERITFCLKDSLWSENFYYGLFNNYSEGDTINGYKKPLSFWIGSGVLISGKELWYNNHRYIRVPDQAPTVKIMLPEK